MYSINPTNGQFTFIRNTPYGLGNFDAAGAVPASSSGAPEPATVFSMLGGLALSHWYSPVIESPLSLKEYRDERRVSPTDTSTQSLRHFRRFPKPVSG